MVSYKKKECIGQTEGDRAPFHMGEFTKYTFYYKQPEKGLRIKRCLNFSRLLGSKLLECTMNFGEFDRKQWTKAYNQYNL